MRRTSLESWADDNGPKYATRNNGKKSHELTRGCLRIVALGLSQVVVEWSEGIMGRSVRRLGRPPPNVLEGPYAVSPRARSAGNPARGMLPRSGSCARAFFINPNQLRCKGRKRVGVFGVHVGRENKNTELSSRSRLGIRRCSGLLSRPTVTSCMAIIFVCSR